MNQTKIILKQTDNNIGDAVYKIVQIENSIKVKAGSKEFRINDCLTEAEAEQLVQDRHNKVTVKS